MKKLLAILLVVATLLCVAACGEEPNGDSTTTTTENTTTTTTNAQSDTTTTTTADATTTTVKDEPTTATNDQTTTQAPTTITTEDLTTTTSTTTTTTTTNVVEARKDGVINEQVTKKVTMYQANLNTFQAGEKQEREITFKGTIKIGNTTATSGAFGAVGLPYNEGILSYINKVNFNGGVGGNYAQGVKGYYIEFIHYDDGFDSYTGYIRTKKLVEEDKVFAIVGHFGSPTVGSTIEYIKDQGVVACYMACGLEALYSSNANTVENGSTVFPVQPIYKTEGRIIVGRIVEQYSAATRIGVIYTNDEVGVGIKNGVKAQINAMGSGYECVLAETTTDTDDLNVAVAKLSNCDAVIVASTQNGFVSILKSMIENGIYKPVFTSYSVAAAQTLVDIKYYYDELDDTDKFPIYANAWLSSTDIDSFMSFVEDIISYEGNSDYTVNSYAMAGWIAANVFCEGLERIVKNGKEINNLTFVEAMERAKIEIEMTSGATLDYSNGYRLGTTTMALLRSNTTCDNFEEAEGMKDFIKFIKTGNVSYAQ